MTEEWRFLTSGTLQLCATAFPNSPPASLVGAPDTESRRDTNTRIHKTSVSLARLTGIKAGLITKRVSEVVALRTPNPKLEFVRRDIQGKCGKESVLRLGLDVGRKPVMPGCPLLSPRRLWRQDRDFCLATINLKPPVPISQSATHPQG